MTCGAALPAVLDPLAGETRNQPLPPERVDVDAVQDNEPEPGLTTPKVCGGTTPPCATALKLSPVCVSKSACERVLMLMVTGIERVCPLSPLMVRVSV